MGSVNAVVPQDQLDAEVKKWCDEIVEKSPTAIALAKKSFNVDTEMIRGMGGLAMHAPSCTTKAPSRPKAAMPSAKSASRSSAST
jgi:1,4-dihydroxy-2-naphthoyl-CoA synthase